MRRSRKKQAEKSNDRAEKVAPKKKGPAEMVLYLFKFDLEVFKSNKKLHMWRLEGSSIQQYDMVERTPNVVLAATSIYSHWVEKMRNSFVAIPVIPIDDDAAKCKVINVKALNECFNKIEEELKTLCK